MHHDVVMNGSEDDPLMLEDYHAQTPKKIVFALGQTFSGRGLRILSSNILKQGQTFQGTFS